MFESELTLGSLTRPEDTQGRAKLQEKQKTEMARMTKRQRSRMMTGYQGW